MSHLESTPTVAIILDERYKSTTGLHPVKVRITFEREQNYYSIPDKSNEGKSLFLSMKEFYSIRPVLPDSVREKQNLRRGKNKIPPPGALNKRLKDIKTQLIDHEAEIRTKATGLLPFTWEAYLKEFTPQRKSNNTLKGLLQGHIENLLKSSSFGTANTYESTLSCLNRYKPKDDVKIHHVDKSFLTDWKTWMMNKDNEGKGLSHATIGIYMRCIRMIMNDAIDVKKIIKRSQYPFPRKSNLIPAMTNTKKALSKEDINRIYSYPAKEGSRMQWARDMWMLSFMCNGANVKDIIKMKWKNIQRDRFTFVRTKTGTTGEPVKIEVILTPEALEIIKRWGTVKTLKGENYVFKIISSEMTDKQKFRASNQMTKDINKYMDDIRIDLGIEERVLTYSCRHSYASLLNKSGAPLSYIAESLGHKNTKTTEGYLASMQDDKQREYSNLIRPTFVDVDEKKAAG